MAVEAGGLGEADGDEVEGPFGGGERLLFWSGWRLLWWGGGCVCRLGGIAEVSDGEGCS